MTNEKAIEVLEYARNYDGMGYGAPSIALDMAISAIRQETVTDRNELIIDDLVPEMTLDDAIAHLDDTLSDTGRKWSCESCRMEHVQLRAWLAELRDIKEKRNKPLTLGDLREMDGEPMWTVTTGLKGSGRWEIVRDVDEYMIEMCNCSDGIYCIDVDTYGKNWLAYRQKPEEGTV